MYEEFSANLRRLRLDRRLSQSALARRSHITQQQISAYENGLRPRGLRDVAKLARALDVDTADLQIQHVVVAMPIRDIGDSGHMA